MLTRLSLSALVELFGDPMTPQQGRIPDERPLEYEILIHLNSSLLQEQHLGLLFGEMAELEAGLQHAQDRVASDHADDVAFRYYGHLVNILTLHALQNG
jgi:hypothetical protein